MYVSDFFDLYNVLEVPRLVVHSFLWVSNNLLCI